MTTLAGLKATKWRWSVFGVALTAGLGACGGSSTLSVGEPKADAADYCAKALAIDSYPDPDIDFETATPEQMSAGVKAYAAGLVPLAEQAAAVAPDDIKADVDVLVGVTKKVAETGDFSAFEADPAVQKTGDKVHAFDVENCGYGKAEVTGKEYSFDGIPKKSEAGPVSFEFSNKGKEPHELTIFRINDGTTETLDELLALPDDQAFSKVEVIDSTGPIDPGADEHLIAQLTPGHYGVVCFIPTGDNGPPHFTKGMKGEFEVV